MNLGGRGRCSLRPSARSDTDFVAPLWQPRGRAGEKPFGDLVYVQGWELVVHVSVRAGFGGPLDPEIVKLQNFSSASPVSN